MRLMPYTAPPAFEAYVSVPFPINTFTLYKSFYMDYGLYGAVLMMSVIGFFHSLLYRKARMNSELGLFMFAVSMYPLIMVFFVDAYTSFALYIHAFIFATAYMTLRSFRWGIFREAADDAVQRSQIGRVQ
jgi:oligosaccharide repeat unit polymerase